MLETLFDELENKKIGIINASPLNMGLPTERGAPTWHPAPAELKAACTATVAWCRGVGVDITKLAVQFAVANPRIASTLIGTASSANIRKNVHWIEQPMDEELLAQVRQKLEPLANRPLANRPWKSGRDENN